MVDILLVDFATASHLTLVASLGPDHYLPCARQFLAAVYKDRNFAWSGQLIDLLASLPPEEVRPLFRKQWPNVTLRDELILKLGEKPELIDRDKFITGLSSVQPDVVRASMSALLQLPRDETGKIMIPTMRLLRRLLGEPRETTLRAQWVALFNWETGASLKVQEQFADAPSLKLAYQPAVEIFNLRYPSLIRSLDDEPEDPAQWNFLLKTAPWDRGNAARGESLFRDRGCQACHTSATPLGPDLGGVTGRFSQTDLFNAILYPNREVAAPYRTTLFQTHDGHTYTGLVAYESADGVILRTGATSTLRLADTDIASRQPSNLSLMPSGLLAGLKPLDLADLYSYLKTLTPR